VLFAFNVMTKYLDDLLILGGCGLVLYGTFLVNPVAVWFVGGGMLIALGVLFGAGKGKQ
jgi:hypothetical protein